MLAALARLWPLDPDTGSRVEMRVSAHNDSVVGRVVNGLGDRHWEPAIVQPPVLRLTLFDGDFTSPISAAQASIPINMQALAAGYPNAGRYIWQGAPVEIYAEDPATAWPWPARFTGKVESFTRSAQKLTLTASVDAAPFQVDQLPRTYAGTGDAEGGIDLKGKAKPLVLGWALNVEPVLIDATNSVYQFSGYGPIDEVSYLFERGSDFGAAIGDYADYAALVAADIAGGQWGSCLAEGLIRLGAPAYGVITGDVKGHTVGAGTPRYTGAVIAALASIAGVEDALIDGDSLDAIDAAAPYHINLVLTDQASVIDTVQRLALPIGAQAGVGLDGRLFISHVTFSTAQQARIDAKGRTSPQVVDSREDTVSPPFYRIVLGANRAWRVHTTDEIAFEAPIVPRGLYSTTETYREGNIVSLADQSEWIYISTTPTAGNAPPTWPTTSNTWWSNTKPPYDASGITYADGTPLEDLKPAQGGATRNVPTGAWASGVSYIIGDIAEKDGSSYSCIANHTSSAGNAPPGSNWSLLASAGAAGSGATVASVYLYKRAATMPALPTADVTFTFSSGAATGLTNGWTQDVPAADGNPLWVTTATASSTSASDTIASGEWATPAIMTQDGRNNATVFIYKRAASTPALPSATTTFTFATGALTGLDNGWSQAIPATDGNPLYVAVATATAVGATDTIAPGEWASPVIIVQDGPAGPPGPAGPTGASGAPAVSIVASKKATVIPVFANGGGGDFSGANGLLKVYSGSTDVTGSASFAAAASSGVTGTINTAANTPVSGQPKGYYQITAMSGDSGYLTISATYGGVTLTETFSVTKAKGGFEIVGALPSTDLFEGRVVYLTTDDKLYRYTGSAWTRAVDGADINAGTVTTNALAAGAVTAAKIAVTQLDAIAATIGLLRTATSGARQELESNQLRVYDASNVLRVRLGIW